MVGMLQVIPLLPDLGVPEADVGAEVDKLLAAGQDLSGQGGDGARVDGGEHHVALLDDGINGSVVHGKDLLVIEAHQGGMLVLNLAPGGEGVGHVGDLGLRVMDHQTQQFAAGIAGCTANGKTNHCTLPPEKNESCKGLYPHSVCKHCGCRRVLEMGKVPKKRPQFSLFIIHYKHPEHN